MGGAQSAAIDGPLLPDVNIEQGIARFRPASIASFHDARIRKLGVDVEVIGKGCCAQTFWSIIRCFIPEVNHTFVLLELDRCPPDFQIAEGPFYFRIELVQSNRRTRIDMMPIDEIPAALNPPLVRFGQGTGPVLLNVLEQLKSRGYFGGQEPARLNAYNGDLRYSLLPPPRNPIDPTIRLPQGDPPVDQVNCQHFVEDFLEACGVEEGLSTLMREKRGQIHTCAYVFVFGFVRGGLTITGAAQGFISGVVDAKKGITIQSFTVWSGIFFGARLLLMLVLFLAMSLVGWCKGVRVSGCTFLSHFLVAVCESTGALFATVAAVTLLCLDDECVNLHGKETGLLIATIVVLGGLGNRFGHEIGSFLLSVFWWAWLKFRALRRCGQRCRRVDYPGQAGIAMNNNEEV